MSETVFCAVSTGTALLFMVTASYEDLRTRTVSGRVLLHAFLVSFPVAMAGHFWFGRSIVPGLIPGGVLLLLSLLFRGHLGTGDGLFVLEMGLFLPWDINAEGVITGILLCGLLGFFLVCFKVIRKESKLPMIPLLSCGYLTALIRWRLPLL